MSDVYKPYYLEIEDFRVDSLESYWTLISALGECIIALTEVEPDKKFVLLYALNGEGQQ